MAPAIAPDMVDQLLAAARAAQARAHAPYSRFRVGAAVLDEQGRVHAGCNVENAAYPLGTCAETLAIATMVREGGKSVRALLVLGDGDALVTPCGGCRQRLREFMPLDGTIHLCSSGGERRTVTLETLLPYSFGPEFLPT